MSELAVKPSGPLKGRLRAPGDKSISHRAVILSAIAEGETRVEGLLWSEDVRATIGAFQGLGVEIIEEGGKMMVKGRGGEALKSPAAPLDLGNSGTSMRLLTGLLCGLPVEAVLIGDESLSRRPMGRVIEPLRLMGAEINGTEKNTAPLVIRGRKLRGVRYRMPVASAQVKSALLLAGLFAEGETWVEEPAPSRDHTERMLPAFGADLLSEGDAVGVRGGQRLASPGALEVPGDFSSAAFFVVAALIVPGSELVIENVGVNQTRTGLLDILELMGAKVSLENQRVQGREPMADLRVRASRLRGVEVRGDLIPRAIDEIPALCVAAALAEGETVIREASELRVKESDRIASMVKLLSSMGARVREFEDGLAIEGGAALAGVEVDCGLDHRIGMAAAVAGLAARGRTLIRGAQSIATSFPEFERRLTGLVE